LTDAIDYRCGLKIGIQYRMGSPLTNPASGGRAASLLFARSIPGCEATGEGLSSQDWSFALLRTNLSLDRIHNRRGNSCIALYVVSEGNLSRRAKATTDVENSCNNL